MIKPTIGRIVWVSRPDGSRDVTQPEAAFVTYVHSDRSINVTGFSAQGEHFHIDGCPLLQDDDAKPEGNFACWMPYQVQAAKYVDPASGATGTAMLPESKVV